MKKKQTFYFIYKMLMWMEKLEKKVGYRQSRSSSCCLSLSDRALMVYLGLELILFLLPSRDEIIQVFTVMSERIEVMEAIHSAILQVVPSETKPC